MNPYTFVGQVTCNFWEKKIFSRRKGKRFHIMSMRQAIDTVVDRIMDKIYPVKEGDYIITVPSTITVNGEKKVYEIKETCLSRCVRGAVINVMLSRWEARYGFRPHSRTVHYLFDYLGGRVEYGKDKRAVLFGNKIFVTESAARYAMLYKLSTGASSSQKPEMIGLEFEYDIREIVERQPPMTRQRLEMLLGW